ncbi:Bgt-50463 [Blumeria graminis f. sp. tritici]|uniref:Bgt-50463 n=1 Tax=Blumeria graminis f. sp. tritici TaxID=62690 RepID=A0A9X9MHP1_BLUGR|nr:Bgt-50463 [Blumeria graminis f. sp. tritici]
MEKECPGAGADFLALISEGVSRAIRGQKIYKSSMNEQEQRQKPSTQSDNKKTWASKAAAGVSTGIYIDLCRPMTRPTPPQNQSKGDKRIMIRLDREHEARKADPFLLRQQVQRLIPDPSIVVDAW